MSTEIIKMQNLVEEAIKILDSHDLLSPRLSRIVRYTNLILKVRRTSSGRLAPDTIKWIRQLPELDARYRKHGIGELTYLRNGQGERPRRAVHGGAESGQIRAVEDQVQRSVGVRRNGNGVRANPEGLLHGSGYVQDDQGIQEDLSKQLRSSNSDRRKANFKGRVARAIEKVTKKESHLPVFNRFEFPNPLFKTFPSKPAKRRSGLRVRESNHQDIRERERIKGNPDDKWLASCSCRCPVGEPRAESSASRPFECLVRSWSAPSWSGSARAIETRVEYRPRTPAYRLREPAG